MEKYGVGEDEAAKIAEEGEEKCPKCGGAVDSHGKVSLCKKCGSEPFEPEKEAE